MNRKTTLLTLLLIGLLLAGCAVFSDEPMKESDQPTLLKTGVEYYKAIEDDISQDRLLVRATDVAKLDRALAVLGGSREKDWDEIGWFLVDVPADETTLTFMKKIEAWPGIVRAEPDLMYEVPEPMHGMLNPDMDIEEQKFEILEEEDYMDRLWGMENIRAHDAWEINTGCEDVLIAIIDTGVDITHPEWEDHSILYGFDATQDGSGWEFFDLHGHGTHVAGTAVSSGEVGNIAGVAWDNPLVPIRAMDATGTIFTSYLIEAVLFSGAVAEFTGNPVVMNMSIGGRGYNMAFKDAIDYALAQGAYLVTSAGNDRKQVISYPSAYNGVITVAASDGNNEKVGFSTVGFWNSVAAPGSKIWSAFPTYAGLTEPYVYMAGTSMASPHVAGAVALLLSEHPGLSFVEIKSQVEQTAQGNSYTPELGYGIIDVEAMLGELQPVQYGSIYVDSNVSYGILSVFNEGNNLVTFGSTGLYRDHTFQAIEPGEYTVYFSAGGVVESETVTVETDEVTAIDFEAPAGGVAGTVTCEETGDPVEGAFVYIAGVEVLTNPDGEYIIDGLPAGTYLIYVGHDVEPFEMHVGVVIIEADTIITYDVELEEEEE